MLIKQYPLFEKPKKKTRPTKPKRFSIANAFMIFILWNEKKNRYQIVC